MKRVKILISGEVQGVYFRAFIKDRAEELGLNGYTKNVPIKKVEIIVEGHEAKIQKLVDLCRQGPRGALVNEVKTESLPFTGEFKSFRIKVHLIDSAIFALRSKADQNYFCVCESN